MDYQIIPAPAELKHIVKYFWTLDLPHQPPSSVAMHTFVDDSSGLIFHHHKKMSAVKKNGEFIPQWLIYGQATTPSVTEVSSPFCAIGVLFQPQSIHRLFGIDASYFSDRIYSLASFSKGDDLTEALLHTDDKFARVEFLKEFLMKKSKGLRDDDKLVRHCVDLIKSHKVCGVKALLSETKMSERQLQRRFLSRVGVSPRHYIMVAKFEMIVNVLRKFPDARLGDIAYSLDFSDQPHLNKLFKKLSGLNPKGFKKTVKDELINLMISRSGMHAGCSE
jgi:AraC-like DNA-binding protein